MQWSAHHTAVARASVVAVCLASLWLATIAAADLFGREAVPRSAAARADLAARLVADAVRRAPLLGDDPDLIRVLGPGRSFADDMAAALALIAAAPHLDAPAKRRVFRAVRAGDSTPLLAALRSLTPATDAGLAARAAVLRLRDRNAALAASRRAAEREDSVAAWLRHGHVALHLQAYDTAFAAYERVVRDTDVYGDRLAAGEAMAGFALVARARGDLDNAIAFQYEALRLHDSMARLESLAVDYSHLGTIEEAAGNFERAVSAFRRALDLERQLDRPAGIAAALFDLGRVHDLRGERGAACEAWRQRVASRPLPTYLADPRGTRRHIAARCGAPRAPVAH